MNTAAQKILGILHRSDLDLPEAYEALRRIMEREETIPPENALTPLSDNLSGYPRGWETFYSFPGGLHLQTRIYDNGDGKAVFDQALSSTDLGGNVFGFHLSGASFTPKVMVRLASQIEGEVNSRGFEETISPLPGKRVPEDFIVRTVATVNPRDNGGESLNLVTDYFRSGESQVVLKQELTLQSYFNSTSLTGTPLFLPEDLRKAAKNLGERIQETGLSYE